MISKKVILTGSFGVGKTSIFNQFLFQKFSDKYLTTIGVKVNKKTVEAKGQEVSLLVWDIAGEVTQDKVPTSYFLGASGIIYVMDLSRPLTFEKLDSDIAYLEELLPGAAIKIVGNKKDLLSQEELLEAQQNISKKLDAITSAKTGENIPDLFLNLAEELV